MINLLIYLLINLLCCCMIGTSYCKASGTLGLNNYFKTKRWKRKSARDESKVGISLLNWDLLFWNASLELKFAVKNEAVVIWSAFHLRNFLSLLGYISIWLLCSNSVCAEAEILSTLIAFFQMVCTSLGGSGENPQRRKFLASASSFQFCKGNLNSGSPNHKGKMIWRHWIVLMMDRVVAESTSSHLKSWQQQGKYKISLSGCRWSSSIFCDASEIS